MESEAQKQGIAQELIEFTSCGAPKMRNIVMVYLATQLSESSYKKMRFHFREIDKNLNGTICFHEFKSFMS